jgi:hypothetical protein
MSIVGQYPEGGVRIDIARAIANGVDGPPWHYQGEAVTPSARFALQVLVGADGSIAVELAREAPPGLGEKTRLMLRAVWRHATESEAPPPRRIVRWRPDR